VDSLSSDFEELLTFLNARHVRAIIVGGHALAFHGHPRYTKDLDIHRAVAANAAAWADRVEGAFGSAPVSFLGRAAFVKNKQAAGRPQDLADIDALS
jgi:hypothetical protein